MLLLLHWLSLTSIANHVHCTAVALASVCVCWCPYIAQWMYASCTLVDWMHSHGLFTGDLWSNIIYCLFL